MRFFKIVCNPVRLVLLFVVVLALVLVGRAVTEGAFHQSPAGVSHIPEAETMFLTGLVLLGLGFLARQFSKKDGPKSVS